MKRIGILGDIGSGKSYIAKCFGYPVFNADKEVAKIYNKEKKIFFKLKKILPKYINSFPIKKREIINAILDNKDNLEKIIRIIHIEVRKKMYKILELLKKFLFINSRTNKIINNFKLNKSFRYVWGMKSSGEEFRNEKKKIILKE